MQAGNPTTPVTQVDLVAMEQRYQDMLRDALALFHVVQQTLPAPIQTLVEPQDVSDQLLAEAKHLEHFRKYNLQTFDGSLEDPTKAHIWFL